MGPDNLVVKRNHESGGRETNFSLSAVFGLELPVPLHPTRAGLGDPAPDLRVDARVADQAADLFRCARRDPRGKAVL
ncbi:MAG: hypothetical protein ACHQ0I_03650, partial [Candidatus Lutacidiplasmatales archaeon]